MLDRAGRLGAAVIVTLATAVLNAQARYGSGRAWWNPGQGGFFSWEETSDNPDGQVSVLSKKGVVRTEGHPFFEPLGANGRSCVTCHQPSSAMSVSAAALRQRWEETQGKDPVFAAVDGSNCPDLPPHARSSHSLLLNRGLFRIFLPWPPKTAQPEFRIEVVRDPTGCNTSPVHGIESSSRTISVFRRPRVAANLEYVVAGPEGMSFMADGREASLQTQAANAILIHEQASKPPDVEQLRRIVDFESQLFTAQSADIRGGLLNERDGPGLLGPENLASGKAGGFAAAALLSFTVWRKPNGAGDLGLQREFRASVARGGEVFFGRRFRPRETATATCATCHSPDMTRWMDIGTTNRPAAKDSADLPLFRITCDSAAPPHPGLGRVIYTQDPGRALISGKCADVGSIVIQQLRGLAARAPYFSNGSAQTLREVIDFYDHRFDIRYTEQEKQDLVNFLRVL